MGSKFVTTGVVIIASLAIASAPAAHGRLAGAVVGAAAGAHSKHAMAGAVAGGAIGRHMSKTHQKKMAKKGT